jgi:hypothetical protein
LFEVLCEAGVHAVTDTHHPAEIVFWNNHADERLTYRYSDIYLFFGFVRGSNHSHGVLPRFASFVPPEHVWRHGAYEEHTHHTQWSAQVDYLNLFSAIVAHQEKIP